MCEDRETVCMCVCVCVCVEEGFVCAEVTMIYKDDKKYY
jgi:hypothetical protein